MVVDVVDLAEIRAETAAEAALMEDMVAATATPVVTVEEEAGTE